MFVNVSRSDSVELVVERSMSWRIATYVIATVVTVFFGVLLAKIPGPPRLNGGASPPSFNVMWLFVAAMDVMILWFGSPHEMRFDLRKGTYTGKSGFLLFPRAYSGSFADFYGLCIRPTTNKRGYTVSYRIELDWANGRRGSFELVSSLNMEKAQAKQMEIAAKLGIHQLGCEI